MGGQTPAQQTLRGDVANAGGAPQGMASGGKERRYGRARVHRGGRTGEHKGGGRNWAWFVDLVQPAFRDGDLAEEATWQAVVLIHKGKKDYQGIGLVEVMWKVVAAIINCRFTASITYHDFLHGFKRVEAQITSPSRPSCYSSLRP